MYELRKARSNPETTKHKPYDKACVNLVFVIVMRLLPGNMVAGLIPIFGRGVA